MVVVKVKVSLSVTSILVDLSTNPRNLPPHLSRHLMHVSNLPIYVVATSAWRRLDLRRELIGLAD
jgi:hypothetical protein